MLLASDINGQPEQPVRSGHPAGRLGHAGAARAGVLLLLQPLGAFVWNILLFQRATTGRELAGAALALVGIYLGGARK